jgi:hypothetical protein
MTEMQIREQVPGAAPFIDWFGRWPQFHDSEVVRCDLQRSGESSIFVHTFNMTNRTQAGGHYILDKHAIVTFRLSEIESFELYDFNGQNALMGLRLERGDEHFTLSFDAAYGLAGKISARELRLEWTQGKPSEGVYA